MNNAETWLHSLPENPSPERDQIILDAVKSGLAYCHWLPVTSKIPNHTAIFQVCDDAVRVDLEDGSRFRFQVSAQLAQVCADIMDASLPTTKICDLAYQQTGLQLPATLLPAGPDMVTTAKSRVWNEALEKKRNKQEGLIRDCGKAWILSSFVGAGAINYGFYDPHAPYTNPCGLKMWQCLGTKHNVFHTDYSQTLILMNLQCKVDGQTMSVIEVMKDPELCHLISNEGILHVTRQL